MNARRFVFAAGVSLATLTPSLAAAQQGPSPAPADGADTPEQRSDIIVTASKRDTTLQDATLSVTAISADTLKEANITEITGLNGIVPGLVVARSGGGERLISIRGIGSETPANANTQPGVSYHVDGVYIFNSVAANAAFIDIGQIEILRGPQGTTFGQGSTGGTINVVTNQPSTADFSGALSAGVGNYGLTKGDASINIPLGQFAVRGAVQYLKRDGYAVATGVPGTTEYDLDDQNEIGWKLAGLWQPTANFSILLNTIQYESDTNGPAQKNILDPDPDPRRLTQDYPARSIIDTELYYGVARLETDFAVIKSITSFQKLYSRQAWDADGLTADLFQRNLLGGYRPPSATTPERLGARYDHVPLWQQNTESWTQEINLASNQDGPFSWIAGGVYLWSKNSQYIVEYRSTGGDPYAPPLPVDTPFNSPLVPAITYAELSEITRNAYAGYVEASYSLTDALNLTAGIRYNHDEYTGVSDTIGGGPTLTSGAYLQPTQSPGLTTGKWTGKAAIDYKWTPDNMVYFSFTRGFKPGGLNASASNAAPQLLGFANGIRPTYAPESVDSFELGSKNSFGGDTVTLNLSAFYYDYKNLQFLEEDAILFGEGISNAPSAEIYGIEIEGAWRPDDHWSLEGTASFTRGKFNADYLALDPAEAALAQYAAGYFGVGEFFANFFPASLARDSARENINGNNVPKIPKFQGSTTLGYVDTLGAGVLTSKATLIYRGEYQYRLYNNSAVDITPDYLQANLFVQYQPNNSNLSFSLSVTNLFDEAGINSRFSDPYGSAQTSDTFIPPRQVLGSIGYRF
ncbi:TonB-dependent receptor [Sphingomonas sp. 37zxx]|uniref:TonB-dependent receptor n=1 Tax=Sphingomonas sp. 37zxx TaxID=1550073 RepID=UPI00053BE4F4|nr:TonB-dependent receptor [Sphingomonas sp. 37zxx]